MPVSRRCTGRTRRSTTETSRCACIRVRTPPEMVGVGQDVSGPLWPREDEIMNAGESAGAVGKHSSVRSPLVCLDMRLPGQGRCDEDGLSLRVTPLEGESQIAVGEARMVGLSGDTDQDFGRRSWSEHALGQS